MGLFSKIFPKKEAAKPQVIVSSKPTTQSTASQVSKRSQPAKLHPKGKPDAEGLYPGDIAMLNVVETLKVGSEKFPALLDKYGVTNPAKTLNGLNEKGYIAVGDAKSALNGMKVGELKEVANTLGVKQSGKKNDIITAISEVDESAIAAIVTDRMWTLTDSGREAIKRNAYVGFFMESKKYDLLIDFWKVSEICIDHPKMKYRDVVYHQIDDAKNEASVALMTDPTKSSYASYQFCECLRAMALFIEEEGSSYINAADLYFQYLFECINVRGGMRLVNRAKFFQTKGKLDSKGFGYVYDEFCDNCCLAPYEIEETMRLKEEAGISDDAFRDALIRSFERAEHSGFVSTGDAADFIILELSGEDEKARNILSQVAKQTIRAVGIKC